LMVTVGLGLAPRDFRALAARPLVVAAPTANMFVKPSSAMARCSLFIGS